MTTPRFALLLPAAALVLALSACGTASTPETAPTTPAPAQSSAPAAEQPGETPAPAETTTPEDLTATCDTLIGADLVTELEGQGWSYREDPFTILDSEYPDGIACTWGDFTTASGNLLLWGWSPIGAEETTAAQDALVAEGWIVEESDAGVYVTEDPNEAINTDEGGYGMTYLFGDGWVTVSDTRQGLLLIERPGA